MKYNIGDKVRISPTITGPMSPSMEVYCNSVMTIQRISQGRYRMVEDEGWWAWDDDCIERLANKIRRK